MKILRRRVLGSFSAIIFILSFLFLPAIVGVVFWGQGGLLIGLAVSLVLFFANIATNCLDGHWTHKIASRARIHSVDYQMKRVEFEFNKEIVSLRLPACDRFFMQNIKSGEVIPVLVTVGKVSRTIQDIRPITR